MGLLVLGVRYWFVPFACMAHGQQLCVLDIERVLGRYPGCHGARVSGGGMACVVGDGRGGCCQEKWVRLIWCANVVHVR